MIRSEFIGPFDGGSARPGGTGPGRRLARWRSVARRDRRPGLAAPVLARLRQALAKRLNGALRRA